LLRLREAPVWERQLLATVNGEALRDFERRTRARAWQVLR
jgi:hypothetical protein